MKSKEQKKIEGELRQAEHNQLSTVEKLEKCLSRSLTVHAPRDGREAKKLYAQLAKEHGIKGEYTTHLIAPYVRAKN